MIIKLLFWMVLAHLLYDFHWQNDFISKGKSKYNFILGVHALTWTMMISIPLLIIGQLTWVILLFLFGTHFLIDYWKCHLPHTDEYFWAIYIDQGLHLITILIVLYYFLK